MTLPVAGCLDPSPEYTVPERMPPVVITSQIVPSPRVVTSIDPSTTQFVDFSVPFRSDDAGEALTAYFVENIPSKVDFGSIIDSVPIPSDGRSFADQGRAEPGRVPHPPTVPFHWVWLERPKGCVTVTMILSYNSNFTVGKGYDLRDDLNGAEVTWLFDFLDPESHLTAECPANLLVGAPP